MERFGARRGLTGEPLDPILPSTAEALADGAIGPHHAAAVAETVEAIPASDRAEHAASVETTLLEHARTSDPRTIHLLGQRILAHLDPDGPSPEEQRQQQTHRRLSLARLPESTGLLDGRLTPSCLALWETIRTPLAASRPDDALGLDNRTPSQRLHDAFEEAGRRLLAAGDLPDHAGLPSRLIITMSLTDLERRAGRATTHHGGTISVQDALHTWPPKVTSYPRSSTTTAASSATVAAAASPHPASAARCSLATGAAPFPAATAARLGRRSTTPPTGRTADTPTSTPWQSPAATTTIWRPRKVGGPS